MSHRSGPRLAWPTSYGSGLSSVTGHTCSLAPPSLLYLPPPAPPHLEGVLQIVSSLFFFFHFQKKKKKQRLQGVTEKGGTWE